MAAWESLHDLLMTPVPAWITLWAVAAVCLFQHVRIVRRLNSHARSIGHIDDWADTVESRLHRVAGERYVPAVPVFQTPPEKVAVAPYANANVHRLEKPQLPPDEVKAALNRLRRRARAA